MSDIATPGPIDPADGQPDRRAEVSALKAWFRENLFSLALTAVGVALVFIYLDPLDTLKVMVRERDSKFPLDEITEAEEAVAQLSKDFAGTSIQIARAAG